MTTKLTPCRTTTNTATSIALLSSSPSSRSYSYFYCRCHARYSSHHHRSSSSSSPSLLLHLPHRHRSYHHHISPSPSPSPSSSPPLTRHRQTLSSLLPRMPPTATATATATANGHAFSTLASEKPPSNLGNIGPIAEDATVVGGGEDVRAVPAPGESLTLEGIRVRREKAGKLVAPTASYSDSDMFKSPQNLNKPKARRWDHLLSEESSSRKPCMLKQAALNLKKPGIISLGGGLPSSENFPIDEISIRVPRPPHFNRDPSSTLTPAANASGTSRDVEVEEEIRIGKHDVALRDGVYDLSIALNYGQSIGSAQLLRWVTEHTELVYNPPYADWRCALTIGSTGALESALRTFCDRARNDSLLTEEYSFATALETVAPLGIRVFGVAMDGQGLRADSLDEVLTNWDEDARGGARKPTVLYTVPSGQNPTGATMGTQRRRDIYDVCSKHDVYIFEDEPYYFLQMPDYKPKGSGSGSADYSAPLTTTPNGNSNGNVSSSSSPSATEEEAFLKTLIPTLLSMDRDGRVLRMDSFSKVVVPGARTGWITASAQVVERYIRHAECASQGPSGISQAVLYKLLDEAWGHAGYLRWLMSLRDEYARRRDTLLAACEEFLPREVVSWVPPKAGMFLWLKIDHTKHPDFSASSGEGEKKEKKGSSILDIEEGIFDACIDKGVLACRGSWFRAEQDREPSGLFFRVTFAAASEGDMRAAIERLGAAVRESFGL
ncbi:pyridoxal phosphate-dependent transferase [Biscogniauxia marginata]|nr:pyridoxal phosphate-dependent transferase [Biscogniauxia marginata]